MGVNTMKLADEFVDEIHRTDIQNAWRRSFGRPAPKYLSTSFMQRTLAWEDQAKVAGGLPADLKRSLRAGGKSRKVRQIGPGTHLVREWNGRTYQVEVRECGFRMDGRDFSSLSAVAKKITGAHWSGPRFFGLTGGKHA